MSCDVIDAICHFAAFAIDDTLLYFIFDCCRHTAMLFFHDAPALMLFAALLLSPPATNADICHDVTPDTPFYAAMMLHGHCRRCRCRRFADARCHAAAAAAFDDAAASSPICFLRAFVLFAALRYAMHAAADTRAPLIDYFLSSIIFDDADAADATMPMHADFLRHAAFLSMPRHAFSLIFLLLILFRLRHRYRLFFLPMLPFLRHFFFAITLIALPLDAPCFHYFSYFAADIIAAPLSPFAADTLMLIFIFAFMPPPCALMPPPLRRRFSPADAFIAITPLSCCRDDCLFIAADAMPYFSMSHCRYFFDAFRHSSRLFTSLLLLSLMLHDAAFDLLSMLYFML